MAYLVEYFCKDVKHEHVPDLVAVTRKCRSHSTWMKSVHNYFRATRLLKPTVEFPCEENVGQFGSAVEDEELKRLFRVQVIEV
jgi:hypothetical protein